MCLFHSKTRTVLSLWLFIEIGSTSHFILWSYSFVLFNWEDDMFWFHACIVHSANVCAGLCLIRVDLMLQESESAYVNGDAGGYTGQYKVENPKSDIF